MRDWLALARALDNGASESIGGVSERDQSPKLPRNPVLEPLTAQNMASEARSETSESSKTFTGPATSPVTWAGTAPAGRISEAEACAETSESSERPSFEAFGGFGTLPLSVPAAEIHASPHPVSPFASGLVGEWQRGLAGLDRSEAPCPLFRKWPDVLRVARRFADEHGQTAAGLGWTTLELFGVHGRVGTIRVDCSGALMMSSGRPVTRVTADEIRLGHLTYRRRPWPKGEPVIPVWRFGR